MKKVIGLLAGGIITAGILFYFIYNLNLLREKNEQYRQKMMYYDNLEQIERKWILGNQLPDGAFTLYEWKDGQDNSVNPYFTNIALHNLLYGEPGKEELAAIRRYIEWYFEHLNTQETDPVNGQGTIYDYRASADESGNITVQSKEKYDSVDSYAATFLVLAAHYGETVGDAEWLNGFSEEINYIVGALLRCMNEKGITYTKSEYPIYYLMDNCEVNAGLKAVMKLKDMGIAVESGVHSQVMENLERNTKEILSGFWNQKEARYETGFDEEGNTLEFSDQPDFYPEVVEQIYPVVWEVSDRNSENDRTVYERLCLEWPWEKMQFKQRGDTPFNWTILGYAGALMQDEERVREFLESYQKVIETGHDYPVHIDEAGWVVRTCAVMKEYYKGQISGFFIRK